jgi:hypothetical protein
MTTVDLQAIDVFVEPVLPVPATCIFGASHISKLASGGAGGFSTIVGTTRACQAQPS